MKCTFTFTQIDKRGYGNLLRYQNGEIDHSWLCRSGSCNKEGLLVNSIFSIPGTWTIREEPVKTEEEGMFIKNKAGFGWKVRLWTPKGNWSRYLIHPDGNKPGTKGCVGIQKTNAVSLYNWFRKIWESDNNYKIPLEVIPYR